MDEDAEESKYVSIPHGLASPNATGSPKGNESEGLSILQEQNSAQKSSSSSGLKMDEEYSNPEEDEGQRSKEVYVMKLDEGLNARAEVNVKTEKKNNETVQPSGKNTSIKSKIKDVSSDLHLMKLH